MRQAKTNALKKITDWADSLKNSNSSNKSRHNKSVNNLSQKRLVFDKPQPSAPPLPDSEFFGESSRLSPIPFNKAKHLSVESVRTESPPPYFLSPESPQDYFDTVNSLDLSFSNFESDNNLLFELVNQYKIRGEKMDQKKTNVFKRIPLLSTDRSTLDQFLDCVEELISDLETQKEQNDLIKFVIKHKSSGDAYSKLKEFKFENFADFKTKIIHALFPNETSNVLHARLKNIKQGENQSNLEFVDKFKAELFKLKGALAEEVRKSDFYLNDIKKTFILNLKPKARLWAAMKADSSLDEIINFVIANEDVPLEQNNSLESKLDRVLALNTGKPDNSNNDKKMNSNRNNQKSFNRINNHNNNNNNGHFRQKNFTPRFNPQNQIRRNNFQFRPQNNGNYSNNYYPQSSPRFNYSQSNFNRHPNQYNQPQNFSNGNFRDSSFQKWRR